MTQSAHQLFFSFRNQKKQPPPQRQRRRLCFRSSFFVLLALTWHGARLRTPALSGEIKSNSHDSLHHRFTNPRKKKTFIYISVFLKAHFLFQRCPPLYGVFLLTPTVISPSSLFLFLSAHVLFDCLFFFFDLCGFAGSSIFHL